MNYQTHKLNSQNHSHILERQDSVTGDTITANDEVVFCSACQSVFLVESWKYMDKQHCNQIETLGFVPLQEKEIIAKKKISLLFTILARKKGYKTISILYYIIFFSIFCFGYFVSNLLDWKIGTKDLKILISILAFFEIGFVVAISIIIISIKKQSDTMRIFQIHQDKLILFDSIYELKEVATIIYKVRHVSSPFSFFSNSSTKIRIYLHKNLKEHNLDLKIKYPYNIEFLTSLMQISKFTEVIFYTEDLEEYQFIEDKKNEYEGNIILTKKMPFY